jgi:RHS Repeat
MVDGTGTTTWTLDGASRVTSLAQPNGTVSYAFNNAHQRTTMTEPGSAVTNYD